MKKLDSSLSVPIALSAFYAKSSEWEDFVFENEAILIRTQENFIPGPAWMVKASNGCRTVVFIWEVETKYAYPCPREFTYVPVAISEEVVDTAGRKGKVIKHNGNVAILWE